MKKYIAPWVQLVAINEESSLLSDSDPNKKVNASTPKGDIPVMPSQGGTGSTTNPPFSGNSDYAKKNDSWADWEE